MLRLFFTYVFYHYGDVKKSEDAFMSEYSSLTSNHGAGFDKNGDYYPNGTNKEYLFNRVNDNVVLDSTVEVSELADYQSINQINFVVKNRNKNSIDYVVLKIPFIVCENIKIVEIQTTNPFSTNEISPSYATFNGVDYLKIALDSVYDESKIVINYDSCNDFKSYLRQNPFDFIITTGNATCSQFYKNNSHDYTVRIDTTEYSVIELPTLAYRGYKFVYETDDGVITELNGVHGENGFIEITVSTSGNLHVYFEGKYVKIANVLSISGGVLLVIVCIYLFILPEQIRVKTRDFCFKIMKRNKTN